MCLSLKYEKEHPLPEQDFLPSEAPALRSTSLTRSHSFARTHARREHETKPKPISRLGSTALIIPPNFRPSQLLSEVVGKEATADPNREIGFGFVLCSCRACERAGEAKLRGRVRGVPPQRWAALQKVTAVSHLSSKSCCYTYGF